MTVVSAPANLLLLGEYAVLEPGGLGVTVAVERRVRAKLAAAPSLTIEGRWSGGSTTFPSPEASPLFTASVEAVASELSLRREELLDLPLRITIDSSDFYDRGGEKIGLGSSAATAAVLCYALLEQAGGTPASTTRVSSKGRGGTRAHELLDRTFAAALAAHRAAQGGRGSGYDVAASVYGGVGRFVGGSTPSYTPVELPWLPPIVLFRGSRPVPTPDAVRRYEGWRGRHLAEAARLFERSNRCAEAFLAARSLAAGSRALSAGGAIGVELGRSIGVSAEIEPPAGCTILASKALGAGNELGVLFAEANGDLPAGCITLSPASAGVTETSDAGDA